MKTREMESVQTFETYIETEHFPKEKLVFIDTENLRRFHILIRWKDADEETRLLIRDLLKVQYALDYKWLEANDEAYEYVAQKTDTNGDSTNIKTAAITIEPLNNDYKSYISRIPINQKLEIGTDASLSHSIPYGYIEQGKIYEREFLDSGLLEFHCKLPNPIINHFHIGSQEVGSLIRANFRVRYADTQRGKFRLWNFRRNDHERCFVISLWKFYGLSLDELIIMMIDYVKHKYTEPTFYKIGANDHGANILNRERLISFLESLLPIIQKSKMERITCPNFERRMADSKK